MFSRVIKSVKFRGMVQVSEPVGRWNQLILRDSADVKHENKKKKKTCLKAIPTIKNIPKRQSNEIKQQQKIPP